MDLNLTGKTVLVTGGASNIGRAMVLAFAREGANVAIADIDMAQAEKTAADAKALKIRAITIRADVADKAATEAMVKKALDEFGQIDILVNNVGWSIPNVNLPDKPDDQIEKEISINYLAVVYGSRAVTPHMISRKYGKIINIASDAGRIGIPGAANFSGVKGAVISFSRAHAREMGRFGVNVNTVCPGFIVPDKPEDAGEISFWSKRVKDTWTPEYLKKQTQACTIRRLGSPNDVAETVVFLASDKASYITGQAWSIDGGMSML